MILIKNCCQLLNFYAWACCGIPKCAIECVCNASIVVNPASQSVQTCGRLKCVT